MKKIIVLLTLLLSGSLFAETIRVGVFDTRPLAYKSSKNEFRGVAIELLKEITADTDWELTYVDGEYDELLTQLLQGNIDVLPTMIYSPELDSLLDFTQEPVVYTWAELYVRPDAPSITSRDDLAGMRISLVQQDVYTPLFVQQMQPISWSAYPRDTFRSVFSSVQQDSADAALVNRFYGDRFYRQFGLRKTGIISVPVQVVFATASGSHSSLRGTIDTELRRLKNNDASAYYRILRKWVHDGQRNQSPTWIYWILGSIIIFVVFSIIFIAMLQGQVRKQKKELLDDMRKRRTIEKEAARNRSETEAIMQAFPDIIFRIDKSGTYLSYHGEQNQLYVTPNKIVGNTLHNTLPKGLADEAMQCITKVLATGEGSSFDYRLTVLGKDQHYEARVAPLDEERVVAIIRNVTQTRDAREKLEQALSEKEIMLKEIHHRVKNNLQVINSILRLQSHFITDAHAQELFLETRNRVLSMSLVHEKLYQSSDLEHINFSEYLRALTYTVIHSFKTPHDRFDVEFNMEEMDIDVNIAVPCGLIINELVTNALKYGLRGNPEGRLRITHYCDEEENCTVIVSDNGPGYPDGFTIDNDETLGMQLTAALVDQLHGELHFTNDNGAKAELTFKYRREA
jgi:two-component sensor histidine kinase/ABC-type amino acid transport substrate-binding protein